MKTYYLVIYENGKSTGVINAMPSNISKEDAELFFGKDNPTIYRKNGRKKFQVTDKKLFSYINPDGSETLFIVCDADLLV